MRDDGNSRVQRLASSFEARDGTWNGERRRKRRLIAGKQDVAVSHILLLIALHISVSCGTVGLTSAFSFNAWRVAQFTRRDVVVRAAPRSLASTPNDNVSPSVTEKLSRPQRKALERAKKQQQVRPVKISSSIISEICTNGPNLKGNDTATSRETNITLWRRAIQQAQSSRNVHRMRQMAQQCQATNTVPSSIVARLLVALMHCCSETEDVSTLLSYWQSPKCFSDEVDMAGRFRDAALLVRTAVSVKMPRVDMAWSILQAELPLRSSTDTTMPSPLSGLFERAHALISIAAWYFRKQQPWQALGTLAVLEQTGHAITASSKTTTDVSDRTLPWLRLLQEAATCQSWVRQTANVTQFDASLLSMPFTGTDALESSFVLPPVLPSNVVYSVLSAMVAFPKTYTVQCDRMYELISNALVRRVVFVTGAVSMVGCPPSDRGEVCFIGRSNVGKSSLINMVFNRKALAYTSKRPGKTQQFNFFTVNDIPAKEQEIKYGDDLSHLGQTKDDDSFMIVDLPGFGYAQVPEAQRQKWLQFMWEYFRTRPNLRVIFHLIDSRHGPMKDDSIIMKQIAGTLRDRGKDVSYVILLTKADKNVKGSRVKTTTAPQAVRTNARASQGSSGKVSKSVLVALKNTMQDCGINLRTTPIVLSSAETRLGRDDIWRYLQRAAEMRTA